MPGSPRHLDQSTSAVIHGETEQALDEELARQVEAHKHDPIDAVLREVIAEAERWIARKRPALPEHGGRCEAVHEELLEEPTSPARLWPRKSNGANGNGVHG